MDIKKPPKNRRPNTHETIHSLNQYKDMEKKEKLATEFAKDTYYKGRVKMAFISGYESAKKGSDDFAIGFAEWLTIHYHPTNKIGFWQQRSLSEYHSTKDLIPKYKESLKQ